MSKIGRNDPCPCGSGKKYKKCCDNNNVIAFDPSFYNHELDQIQGELMDYAFTNFESDLMMYIQEYIETYLHERNEEITDLYLKALTPWLILCEEDEDGQTIFDLFYAHKQRKFKHTRTKKVFSEWKQINPGIFEVLAIESEPAPQTTLKNILTGERSTIRAKHQDPITVGDFMLGMLAPYVNTNEFIFDVIQVPQTFRDDLMNVIDEMEVMEEDINRIFPRLLADIIQSSGEIDLEWSNDKYELVAALFASHMLEKGADERVITEGKLFWHAYSEMTYPIVKKVASHAAALEYLIQMEFGEDDTITQSQLAKEYKTAAGSISTNYRKMMDYQHEELIRQSLLHD